MTSTLNPAEGEPQVSRLLVIGGAHSGKSAFAEAWVQARGGPKLYVATTQARDSETAARIASHKERRGGGWRTLEAPLDVVEALSAYDSAGVSVLLDGLSTWLSNLMEQGHDIDKEVERLTKHLAQTRARIVLVSDEVGLGVAPETEELRRFRDEAGRLNQRMAAESKAVVFMAAGLPLMMKGPSGPAPGGRFGSARGRERDGGER